MQSSSSRAGITTESKESEGRAGWSLMDSKVPAIRVVFRVRRDFLENLFQRSLHFPAPVFRCAPRIKDHPGNIERPRLRVRLHFHRAEAICTPVAELSQRNAVGQAAAHVHYPVRSRSAGQLLSQKIDQVPGVQAIAYCVSATIKANVFQRTTAQPGVNPKTEDTLIRTTELPSSGEHAATIDPDRKIKGLPILERRNSRSQLGAAISESGGTQENSSEIPALEKPAGSGASKSGRRALPSTTTFRSASGLIE